MKRVLSSCKVWEEEDVGHHEGGLCAGRVAKKGVGGGMDVG